MALQVECCKKRRRLFVNILERLTRVDILLRSLTIYVSGACLFKAVPGLPLAAVTVDPSTAHTSPDLDAMVAG